MGLERFTCIAGLLASLCLPTTTFGAALGALEKTFNFHAGDMAVNPVSPYLYATIPATNSLAVINTNTLTQIATIPLGVAPGAITVSRDGAKVYISNAGTSVLVLDASTNLLTTPLPIGHASASVAIGNDNRLWVLGNGIEQVNATTGVSAGPSAPVTFTYSGKLLASPDGTRLYYATYGLSPGDLYQFDVSGSGVPTTLYHNRSDIGENGEDLVLSNDGSRLAYVCGFGNGGYRIPGFRTSDMSIIANYGTGAYPDALAYSPDNKIAFALHTIYPTAIDLYNTDTGALLGQFPAADRGFLESVDNSGAHLFVAYEGVYFGDSSLKVYSVPEPTTFALLATLALFTRRRLRNMHDSRSERVPNRPIDR